MLVSTLGLMIEELTGVVAAARTQPIINKVLLDAFVRIKENLRGFPVATKRIRSRTWISFCG
jgi:hypothetical protein